MIIFRWSLQRRVTFSREILQYTHYDILGFDTVRFRALEPLHLLQDVL